jgi:hypothetical protein
MKLIHSGKVLKDDPTIESKNHVVNIMGDLILNDILVDNTLKLQSMTTHFLIIFVMISPNTQVVE